MSLKNNNQEEYMSRENKTMFKKISLFLGILVLVFVSFNTGLYLSKESEIIGELAKKEVVYLGKLKGKYSEPKEGVLAKDINFGLFWEVWDSLYEDYAQSQELSEKELFYGAIKGMVASVGDPYTVFMDPKLSKEFNDDLSGTFEGIGAEIGIRDDILTIIAPLNGMPAEKAGLLSGDKVFAINEESTVDMSIDEAVSKIRGEKGTEVVLTIYRKGEDKTKDIAITRGVIHVKSVQNEFREDGLYVVKIFNFNSDTKDLFNESIRDILSKNPAGVILDLRNNSGGYLSTAIEVASEWIENETVVIEQYGNGEKNEYNADGRARLKTFPTVVLINQGSASASEIVAGALKAYDKAKIVGVTSFGKGSVQHLREFGDGSSVKITIANWLTPEGININKDGIEPDHEVEIDIDDFLDGYDAQLNKAIDLLGGQAEIWEKTATSSKETIE